MIDFKHRSFFSSIASLIAVLAGATFLVTLIMRLVPGSPVDHILGEQATDAAREVLSKQLGLVDDQNQPVGLFVQYFYFIRQILTNQLLSYRLSEPVFTLILQRLPYTLKLMAFAFTLASILGVSSGILASMSKRRWAGRMLLSACVGFMAMPRFWIGPLLIWTFAIRFDWLPVGGAESFSGIILPGVTLGLGMAALTGQIAYTNLMQIRREDYIRTAIAKGLSPRVVWFKHALRNVALPLITLGGLQIGALLSGAVVTEKIFNWPGIGLFLLESIQKLDLPAVQGVVLFMAFQYVLINQIIEWIYQWADPRLRTQKP
jgi:peptide/nickel transport system permease protein